MMLKSEDVQRLQFGNITVSCHTPETCARWKNSKCSLNAEKFPLAKKCKDGFLEKCTKYKRTFVPELDKAFVFDPIAEQAEQIAYGLKEDKNILMVGPAGCGKDSIILNMASLLYWPTIRYSCSAEARWSHIFGQWVLVDGNMVWQDGYLMDAYRNGKVYVEDESDFMIPELRGSVHSIMESKSSVPIDAKIGGKIVKEIVHRHKNFRWGSTANTRGYVESYDYAGTQLQNAASRDRYFMIVEVDYPSIENEMVIIKSHLKKEKVTLEDDETEKVINIASQCRSAKKEGKFDGIFSLRRSISWAIMGATFGCAEAAKPSVINFYTPNDQQFIHNLVRVHWGTGGQMAPLVNPEVKDSDDSTDPNTPGI